MKKKKNNVLYKAIFVMALCVFLYAGYRLVKIYLGYKAGTDEYAALTETYTKKTEPAQDGDGSQKTAGDASGSSTDSGQSEAPVAEEEIAQTVTALRTPPLSVDFEALRAVNPDVIGWIYVEAFPEMISYPVMQAADNDYYLRHSFQRQEITAGSIFAEMKNSADFSDPNTILYGHNMKNRSMFGLLKFLKEQETYDNAPYFWIFTPEGDFCYEIFAAFDTPVEGEVYTLFSEGGKDFVAWEKRMQAASYVKNIVEFKEEDHVVTLSTCTSNDATRCVVLGKRIQ